MVFTPRKRNRIPEYDYSAANYYFLTICTHEKKCIFGTTYRLNWMGEKVKEYIEKINDIYPQVRVDKYVVMPNHVHMILVLEGNDPPSVSHIISQFKGALSKEARKRDPQMQLWQRSFYDHVIRDQRGYEQIWNYIDGNPQCWEKDEMFVENSPF